MLAIRTLDERLCWLRALGSRRKGDITGAVPARFRGVLVTDGYRAYQGLLSRITGIQQCCAHYADTVVMPIPGRWRWRAGVPGLAVSA